MTGGPFTGWKSEDLYKVLVPNEKTLSRREAKTMGAYSLILNDGGRFRLIVTMSSFDDGATLERSNAPGAVGGGDRFKSWEGEEAALASARGEEAEETSWKEGMSD